MYKITIEELTLLFSLLTEHLASLSVKELQLDDSCYWKVNEDEKFSFVEIPSLLTVGDYSEMQKRVQQILTTKILYLQIFLFYLTC